MPPRLPRGTTWAPGTGVKKYRVTVPRHGTVQFGDKRYQHYRDRTPLRLYAAQDHGDKARRASYRRRHAGIRLKDGSRAIDRRYSAAWFSYHFLW